MDWAALIFELFQALIKCLEERRREDVEDGLNNPGFRERRVLCRILRKQGFTGRELRMEVDEGMAYLQDQDAEDISLLLDEAVALAPATKGT